MRMNQNPQTLRTQDGQDIGTENNIATVKQKLTRTAKMMVVMMTKIVSITIIIITTNTTNITIIIIITIIMILTMQPTLDTIHPLLNMTRDRTMDMTRGREGKRQREAIRC